MKRVICIDFDNCFFNRNYLNNETIRYDSDDGYVIWSNIKLLDSIKKDQANFSDLIVMTGSARQSYSTDIGNSNRNLTESSFIALKKISAHLEAKLDNFLLADIYADLPDGKSFDNAIDKYFSGKHSSWVFDHSKISILYAHMHRISSQYPEENIIFDFYDDRGIGTLQEKDVLECLESYFNTHQSLIPGNIILRLNHYSGYWVTTFKPIHGSGLIDQNYRQTTKDLTAIGKTIKPLASSEEFFPGSPFHVKPEHLTRRQLVQHLAPKLEEKDLIIINKTEWFPLKPVVAAKDFLHTAFNVAMQTDTCNCFKGCVSSIFSFFKADGIQQYTPTTSQEKLKLS